MAGRTSAKSPAGKTRAPKAAARPGSEMVIGAAERLMNDGKTEEAAITLLVGILRELGALSADMAGKSRRA